MNIKTLAMVQILAVATMATHASARMAAPPEVVWEQSANGRYQVKTNTRTGQVTVHKAGDQEQVLWRATLPGFGVFYSKVMLADSGDYLLHIRGNHQVHQLDDAAVHVARKDGSIATLRAADFIEALQVDKQPRTSIDPTKRWLQEVQALSAESFTVINAIGQKKVVKLAGLKFEQAS